MNFTINCCNGDILLQNKHIGKQVNQGIMISQGVARARSLLNRCKL